MFANLLQGQVAVVAGGTSPIGMRIAQEFAQAGALGVMLVGRDEARGRHASVELERRVAGARFVFSAADLAEPAQCDRVFQLAVDVFGGIDVYVHCVPPLVAGGRFTGIERASIGQGGGDGGGGLFQACHAVLAHLSARGGAILTFASDAGRVASRGQTLVGATQSAIMQFTRALALEVSAEKVRVNCISPSYVRDTPVYDRLMQQPGRAASVERAASRAALGLPAPEDIAPLALFLCSRLASKITGQVISVNGGLTAA